MIAWSLSQPPSFYSPTASIVFNVIIILIILRVTFPIVICDSSSYLICKDLYGTLERNHLGKEGQKYASLSDQTNQKKDYWRVVNLIYIFLGTRVVYTTTLF